MSSDCIKIRDKILNFVLRNQGIRLESYSASISFAFSFFNFLDSPIQPINATLVWRVNYIRDPYLISIESRLFVYFPPIVFDAHTYKSIEINQCYCLFQIFAGKPSEARKAMKWLRGPDYDMVI